MKFIITFLSLLTLTGLFLIAPAANIHAAVDVISNDACKNANDSPACKNTSNDDVISGKNGLIVKIINIVSWIGGVAAVLIIILAGFRFVTSGGNSETVASAKNTIIYAIIGLIVIVIAQTIVAFVLSKL